MDPLTTPENPMPTAATHAPQIYGLDAFLQQADAVVWGVLAILLVMSVLSWEIMLSRGFMLWWSQRRAARALHWFWAAEALAPAITLLAERERGPEAFAHHYFTWLATGVRPGADAVPEALKLKEAAA